MIEAAQQSAMQQQGAFAGLGYASQRERMQFMETLIDRDDDSLAAKPGSVCIRALAKLHWDRFDHCMVVRWSVGANTDVLSHVAEHGDCPVRDYSHAREAADAAVDAAIRLITSRLTRAMEVDR